MSFIYAEYNMYHNSVDVTTFDGYLLRIDYIAEEGLRTTPCSQCAIDALANKEIQFLFKNGYSIEALSKQYGLAHSTLKKIIYG